MTSKDIQAELEKTPFVPFRLHLVSGKTVDIPHPGVGWLMQNGLLVFQKAKQGSARVGGYDFIALRNIDRLEQRRQRSRKSA